MKKQILFIVIAFLTFVSQAQRPNPKAYELFGQAMQDYQIGDYQNALKSINKAIKKDEKYADAYDLKGRTLLALGDTNLAEENYKILLQYRPNHAYALLELASINFNRGNYELAQDYSQKIIVQDGLNKEVFLDGVKINNDAQFVPQALQNPVEFKPTNLGNGVNSIQEEYFPSLSLDGQNLYFTRRDGHLQIYEQNEDLFISERIKSGFNKAYNIGKPVNTENNEGAFSISADEKYIFFTSCNRAGGIGQCDIWLTSKVAGNWQKPINLGPIVNSKHWESQPSISSDGKKLYFVSNRPGGIGGIDIYCSEFTANGWDEPKNLGPNINTPMDEQFPFIHPDGQTLYFSSRGWPGMGKADFFVSHLKDSQWQRPTNLGYPINTPKEEWNIVVDRKGELAYFSTDGIESGYGGMDIYSFPLPNELKPQKVTYVKGRVFDKKSKKSIGALVHLLDLETGDTIISVHSDAKSGEFLVTLPNNKAYALMVKEEGYLFYSENYDLAQANFEESFQMEAPLEKIEKGSRVVLKNIFFETAKYDLKPNSLVELNNLVKFLEENPKIKIELGGHTDNVGDDLSNKTLSNNRAQSVYNYLLEQGINANRLSFKGYGEEQPIASNDTEEGRALNRRTEFKVL